MVGHLEVLKVVAKFNGSKNYRENRVCSFSCQFFSPFYVIVPFLFFIFCQLCEDIPSARQAKQAKDKNQKRYLESQV